MDPFSLATTIISLVAITTSATKRMHRLIVSMREAPDAILALSNELSDLGVVLLEVENVLHEGRNLPQQSRERLAILLSRVEPKCDEIDKLATKLTRAGSSSILNFSRVAWIDGKAKARSLQKDLRIFRLNIAAILAANTTSGVLRLEVALNGLRAVTQQAQIQHFELHANSLTAVSKHSGLLSKFLDQIGPLIQRHEQISQKLEPMERLYLNDPKEKINGPPQQPYSLYDTYDIQVIGYRPRPCVMQCPCDCHRRRHLNTPPVLNRFMGNLFLGYSSMVMAKSRCTDSSCCQPSKFSMQLIYYFPSWFLNRALVMAVKQGAFGSIQASISLHKIVPQTADVFEFCAAGDVPGIHSLFKLGKASANDTYRAGGSPLLNYAIERGQVQVARFLLTVGADPLLEDGLGRSAIDFACINVFADTFGSTVTKQFRTLFLPAPVLAKRKLSVLHQIVVGLVDADLAAELPYLVHTINDVTWDGKTALSWACRRGDLAAVNILLRHGADPSISDVRGNGPLHSAACSTEWRCITALLHYNADATYNNSRNESPVHYSLFYADDPHYLQPLLDAGANVNGRDYHGDTPLITATYRAPASPPVPAFGAINCVDYLIKRGANTELASAEGNTPLLNAIIHNNAGALLTLLHAGANYRVRNDAGDSVLHLVARHGDLATLRVLMDAALQDLDLDALNNDGYTAKEAVKHRVKSVEGFAAAFNQLLLSIAAEIVPDSMVASTIITVSSYEDAIEYQVTVGAPFEEQSEDIEDKTPVLATVS